MAMPMLLFLEVQTHTSWLRHFKKPSLSPTYLPHCLTSSRHSFPDLETPDCGHPVRGCRPPSPRSQKHSWSPKKLSGIPAEHWAVPARPGGSVVTPYQWLACFCARQRWLLPGRGGWTQTPATTTCSQWLWHSFPPQNQDANKGG